MSFQTFAGIALVRVNVLGGRTAEACYEAALWYKSKFTNGHRKNLKAFSPNFVLADYGPTYFTLFYLDPCPVIPHSFICPSFVFLLSPTRCDRQILGYYADLYWRVNLNVYSTRVKVYWMTLTWDNSLQFYLVQHTSSSFRVVLFSSLRLGLRRGSFLSGLSTKTLYTHPLSALIRERCLAYRNLTDRVYGISNYVVFSISVKNFHLSPWQYLS